MFKVRHVPKDVNTGSLPVPNRPEKSSKAANRLISAHLGVQVAKSRSGDQPRRPKGANRKKEMPASGGDAW